MPNNNTFYEDLIEVINKHLHLENIGKKKKFLKIRKKECDIILYLKPKYIKNEQKLYNFNSIKEKNSFNQKNNDEIIIEQITFLSFSSSNETTDSINHKKNETKQIINKESYINTNDTTKKNLNNNNNLNNNEYKEFLNNNKPLCSEIKSNERNNQINKAKSSHKISFKSNTILEKTKIDKKKIKEKASNSLHKIKEVNENNDDNNRKPKGLYNLGLSCYMNSLLQCLYYIKELREYFIENKNKFSEDKQPICKAFAEVMDKLKNDENDTVNPKEFKKLMGKSNKLFDGYKAADVKDLFFNLIHAFLTELNNDDSDNKSYSNTEPDYSNKLQVFEEIKNEIEQNNNIINKLFIGYYYTIYDCKKSKSNTYSFQTESFILFDLPKIKKYFFNQKELSFNFCNKCKKTHLGESNQFLYRPPKILVIILDRGHGKTFDGKFEIEKNFDFKPFINEENYKYSSLYKLICVSTHRGDSSSSGHYTACCITDKDKYFYFSDSYVNEINEDTFIRDDPYLLFYIRNDDNIESNNEIIENNIMHDNINKNNNNTLDKEKEEKMKKNLSNIKEIKHNKINNIESTSNKINNLKLQKKQYLLYNGTNINFKNEYNEIKNALNYFIDDDNEKYSVNYYYRKNKHPYVWKLRMNGPKRTEYEGKHYEFKLDFNKKIKNIKDNIKFEKSNISSVDNIDISQLDIKYNNNKSFYNNILLLFDKIHNFLFEE